MLYALLKAVPGIFCFMAVWMMVQAYIRRRTGRPADFDVLEEMTHGCGSCGHEGSCGGARHCAEYSVTGGQS